MTINDPLTKGKVTVLCSKTDYKLSAISPTSNEQVDFCINEIVTKMTTADVPVVIHFHWHLLNDPDHEMFPYSAPTSNWGTQCEKNILTMVSLQTNNQDSFGIVKLFQDTIHGATVRDELSKVMTSSWKMVGTDVSQYVIDSGMRPFCTIATLEGFQPALDLHFDPRRCRK